MKTSLYDYCTERGLTALLRQWDTAKNAPLTPEKISYGSKRGVWWKCEKGHAWRTALYARTTSGSACPYCAGQRALPGENDLATLYPDLAAQWHPAKNAAAPADVLPGSHCVAWWVCEKGHEWQAMVKSRTIDGTGCPVCANRRIVPGENDLAATHPDLARQWHPTRNGALTPRDVVAGTRRKVWWLCEKGHEWQAAVSFRADGVGCPICSNRRIVPGENDLASHFPDLAAQWHPDRNGGLTPAAVAPYSSKKVWWVCEKGHAWQAVIRVRTASGSGCPYCAGRRVLAGFNDLKTQEPELAAQWHPALNGALTPEQVTAGSHEKVWWQCPGGHIWKAVIYARAGPRRSGCPVCAGKVRPDRAERYRQAERG